jgi:hypothetical protein
MCKLVKKESRQLTLDILIATFCVSIFSSGFPGSYIAKNPYTTFITLAKALPDFRTLKLALPVVYKIKLFL